MPREPGFIRRGTVGVYSVGALSLAFFERLGAELLIGRRGSRTSNWVARRGELTVDGVTCRTAGRWRRGLNFRDGPLPEVILVCPSADRLGDFLRELAGCLRELDRAGAHSLDCLPYFLAASSGVYFDALLARAVTLARGSGLKAPDFFCRALPRRLFRASAYQAALRLGSGPRADYRVGREAARLVLGRTGLPADRARLVELLRGRGCAVSVERRPGEGEFSKAVVNAAYSSLTQLYSVNGGALVRVRFGDLLPRGSRPGGFTPRRLACSPGEVRARQRRLARAVIAIGTSRGAFGAGARPEELLRGLENYLGRETACHLPSSQQAFYSAVLAGGRPRLMPTEKAIIDPLISMARAAGLPGPAAELARLRAGLLGAFAGAARAAGGLPGATGRLARYIAARGVPPGRAVVVAVDGLPGSGKSTLARDLAAALERLGYAAGTACLDDFYYGEAERRRRGLLHWGPGTHDLGLAGLLGRLKAGCSVRLPVFDKRVRRRARAGRLVTGPLDFLVFEGFGVSLQARGYSAFSGLADLFVLIEAPLVSCRRWRLEAGWRDRRAVISRASFIREFGETWEKIEEQAAEVLPAARARAHAVLRVGAGRRQLGLEVRA